MIDNNQHIEHRVFTLIHPSFSFSADELLKIDARAIKNQLRTHLNRAGVTAVPGYCCAYMHGEYEPFSGRYQLHFHGLCAGEKIKALNNLRNKQGYIRTKDIYRPVVVSQLNDKPRQISYIMQGFWPQKARIPADGGEYYKRARSKYRVSEPYHSLYLIWLDRWKMSDLWLLNGLGFKGGQMVMR